VYDKYLKKITDKSIENIEFLQTIEVNYIVILNILRNLIIDIRSAQPIFRIFFPVIFFFLIIPIFRHSL
jgi:hypothetical protein